MDQYRSRLKLSENFERHWSIRISGEIHVDQSLVHTFSSGNAYGSNFLRPPKAVLEGVLYSTFPSPPKTHDTFIQEERGGGGSICKRWAGGVRGSPSKQRYTKERKTEKIEG